MRKKKKKKNKAASILGLEIQWIGWLSNLALASGKKESSFSGWNAGGRNIFEKPLAYSFLSFIQAGLHLLGHFFFFFFCASTPTLFSFAPSLSLISDSSNTAASFASKSANHLLSA